MRTGGLAGVVAATTGLLITAGLATRGHLLSSGGSVSTRTTAILAVGGFCVAAALIVGLALDSRRPASSARRRMGSGDILLLLVLLAAITAGSYGLGGVFHSHGHPHHRGIPCVNYEQARGRPNSRCADLAPGSITKRARHRAQGGLSSWLAIGAVLALIAGGAVLVGAERRRVPPPRQATSVDRRGAIVETLDLSIDDLRLESDAGRAIIAAYARMEVAFAAAGLAPRSSEAPQEFLTRSLRELEASSGAAARLTELFELAKFSHHAADARMRDEAVEALLAVRNELAYLADRPPRGTDFEQAVTPGA